MLIGHYTSTDNGDKYAACFQMMRDDLFDSGSGERASIPNIALVISDGHSNVNQEDTIPEAVASRIGKRLFDSIPSSIITSSRTVSKSERRYHLTCQRKDKIYDKIYDKNILD